MTKEIIKIKRKQLERIADNQHILFEDVENTEKVIRVVRWILDYEKVIKRFDGKYFKVRWSREVTKSCKNTFNNCNYKEEYEFEEVFLVTKTITDYE